MGDDKDIKEIISEVDADNVSKELKYSNTNLKRLILLLKVYQLSMYKKMHSFLAFHVLLPNIFNVYVHERENFSNVCRMAGSTMMSLQL